MGKTTFRIRKKMGLTSSLEEAMHQVNQLEAMIRSQSKTAKKHRPKYESKRKKFASQRNGLDKKLQTVKSPERRAELENKIERLDEQAQKASKRVRALDQRISQASMAIDDISILRMDIRLADGMDDIDYLENVHSLKSKITQDAMNEEMPGKKFDAVCNELNQLASQTSMQHTGLLEDEFFEVSEDHEEPSEEAAGQEEIEEEAV